MSETSSVNPQSGNLESGVTTVQIALRWGDMDALGHVNNVQIARLFEEARVRAMSGWFGGERPAEFVTLLARQEIEFAAVLHYSGRPVTCELWVSRIGGKSYDLGCRLTDADGGVSALCETTLAVVDLASGRSREIPEVMRTVLEAHLGEPVPFRRR